MKTEKNTKNKKEDLEIVIGNINYSNIEDVIEEIIKNLKNYNLNKLHRLDENLLEQGIIHNNKDMIELTLVTYCIRKVLSKKHITHNMEWENIKEKIIFKLNKAKELYGKNINKYRSTIKDLLNLINNTDELLGYFITNLVLKSKIKLASSAYGYGLSLSKSADLFDVNKDDVMNIIGSTKIPDEDDQIKSIKERVKYISKKDEIKGNENI
jgi:hypothetical protein